MQPPRLARHPAFALAVAASLTLSGAAVFGPPAHGSATSATLAQTLADVALTPTFGRPPNCFVG